MITRNLFRSTILSCFTLVACAEDPLDLGNSLAAINNKDTSSGEVGGSTQAAEAGGASPFGEVGGSTQAAEAGGASQLAGLGGAGA